MKKFFMAEMLEQKNKTDVLDPAKKSTKSPDEYKELENSKKEINALIIDVFDKFLTKDNMNNINNLNTYYEYVKDNTSFINYKNRMIPNFKGENIRNLTLKKHVVVALVQSMLIKRCEKNEDLKEIANKFKLSVDGVYGPNTFYVLKVRCESNGITDFDGKITLNVMDKLITNKPVKPTPKSVETKIGARDKDGNYEKTEYVYDKEANLVSSRVYTINDNNPAKVSYKEMIFDKEGYLIKEVKVLIDPDDNYEETETKIFGKDKDGNPTGKISSIVTVSKYIDPNGKLFDRRKIANFEKNEFITYIKDKSGEEVVENHQFTVKDKMGEDVGISIIANSDNEYVVIMTKAISRGRGKFSSYKEAMDHITKNYKKK